MSEAQVRDRIKEFIHERFLIGRPQGYLQDSDPLLEKGVLDSTGVLELVGFIEEEYGFSVEDDELIPENLGSIRNIVAYVMRKVGIAA